MGNIKNYYIYMYAKRRLEKKCAVKSGLNRLSDKQKVEICETVARQVRRIAIVIGIIYLILMTVLNVLAVMYQYSSPFLTWYVEHFESVMPLTQNGWGYGRAPILIIFILLIPVILITAGPFFLLLLIITNVQLNKKLIEEYGEFEE